MVHYFQVHIDTLIVGPFAHYRYNQATKDGFVFQPYVWT